MSKAREILKASAVLMLIALAGCTFAPYEYLGEDAGYAVASISAAEGTYYNGYSFRFRRLDGSVQSRFYYDQIGFWSRAPTDYKNDKEAGVVSVHSLQPGDYEIFAYDAYLIGVGSRTYGSKEDFSIPFTIVPGETAYLGNFQAHEMKTRGLLGLPIDHGPRFIYSDTMDRDIEIAKKLRPDYAISKVNKFLVDGSALPPLIHKKGEGAAASSSGASKHLGP